MTAEAYVSSRELDVLDPGFMASEHARQLVYDARGVLYHPPVLDREPAWKPGKVDTTAVYVPATSFKDLHRGLPCPSTRGAFTRVGDQVWRRLVRGVPTGVFIMARCSCGEVRYLPRSGWMTGYNVSDSCSTCARRAHRARRTFG